MKVNDQKKTSTILYFFFISAVSFGLFCIDQSANIHVDYHENQTLSVLKDDTSSSRKSVESGDAYFKIKDYLNAKSAYQIAVSQNPNDSVAHEKLRKTIDLLRSQKAQNILFDVAVASADKLFLAGDYLKAQQEYENASKLLPDDPYPKNKINEIIKIQVDRRVKDEEYAKAIVLADKFYVNKNYQDALLDYKKAGTIKPDEKYPQDRIRELTMILADQKTRDDLYNKAIAQADLSFKSDQYPEAIKSYKDALVIKPGQVYPTNKIKEIEGIIARMSNAQAQYDKFITLADSFYIDKKYLMARENYLKATIAKPSESYPKEMGTKADKMLSIQEVAVVKVPEAKIPEAKIPETKAPEAKIPEAKIPETKIPETKIPEVKAPETKIPEAKIPEAIIPEVKTPETIIPETKAPEDPYAGIISTADELLADKSYDKAKLEYQAALKLKSAGQYPKDKIAEIDKILAEIAVIAAATARQKSLDENYLSTIAKADQLLGQKKYEGALSEYQNALVIKPNETYPKERVNMITARIDSLYRANRSFYDKAIAEGDRFYNSFEFDKAVDNYTNASNFLPMEKYPMEMIVKIRKIITENAIVDVLKTIVTIASNTEKQFPFAPVSVVSRKNNFVYIQIKNLSGKPFNVLMRYGKDKQANGGVVMRNLSIDGKVNERLISVRDQDLWSREDNNWISLYPQGGDIEVSFIQISRAK